MNNGIYYKNILFIIKIILVILYLFNGMMMNYAYFGVDENHQIFRCFDFNEIRLIPLNCSLWGKEYNNNLLTLIKRDEANCFYRYKYIPPYQFNEYQKIGKPIIYLYTEKLMDVRVQLNLKNSKFTVVYPNFTEENIWNVHANQNGDIFIKDRKYPYLFWEAESYVLQEMNEGFIITAENAKKFLEEKLKFLGLNERESTDFITFWLPVLYRNKLSLCTFQTGKFFDNFELKITPKPKTIIRIFLSIKKLDSPINIPEQKLKLIKRKGFTVVEWGGSIME